MIGTAEGAARRVLTKGNEAICLGAIAAGCFHYYGYPITPQNDIPEYMSAQLPAIGGTFLQAESEVATINFLLGTAASGRRGMTFGPSRTAARVLEAVFRSCGARRAPR